MDDLSTLSSVIKNPKLVVKEPSSPVIVVGLPRSGSSYLTHVLSCMDNWFIFDDLYPFQKAAALGIANATDLADKRDLLEKYIHALTWQLRAKIKFEENFYVPDLTWDDTYEMESALLQALDSNPLGWQQVLEEWMSRLALHCGKSRWGYKTPQDFMHMDRLADAFPGVKFIFILRDPRKMMRSFKNLPKVKTSGNQDGESRQYHPVIYSLYWKRAFECVNAFRKKGRAPVEIVKFEELVKEPEKVSYRLAEFMNTEVVGNVVLSKGNTSFVNKGASQELTSTEIMICEKIAGSCMSEAGYERTNASFNILDLFDLLKTSFVFAGYQFQRVLKDKRARASIMDFVKNLLKRKKN